MWRAWTVGCTAACAWMSGFGCAGIPAQQSRDDRVHAATLRAQAEQRLTGCLGWNVGAWTTPAQRAQCLEESKTWCRERGLEATCGAAGLWTHQVRYSR